MCPDRYEGIEKSTRVEGKNGRMGDGEADRRDRRRGENARGRETCVAAVRATPSALLLFPIHTPPGARPPFPFTPSSSTTAVFLLHVVAAA